MGINRAISRKKNAPRAGVPWGVTARRSAARLGILCSALLVFLMASSVARAQEEPPESTEPFFSVSSRQTYAPGQQPGISIAFRQVDSLDFRIYRVNNPIQFFAKLKDAHSFGSIKQELAREKTWLERLHDWKRDLRFEIRNFIRSQVRWETRVEYHATQVAARKVNRIPLDVTSYAQVPLLNRQQLVLSWRELVPRTRQSEWQDIPIDLHTKGLYLIEVTHAGLRAYTLLMITDLALVTKSAPGQILLFVAHRDSGAPVPGAQTVIFNNHQEVARGTTDAQGISQATLKDIKVENAIMVAKTDQDFAAASVEPFFFYDTSATEYVGYVYTDRPVYRPTHEVNFKGIVRARRGGEYSIDLPGPVTVEIADANQKTIYQHPLSLTPFGTFNGKLALGPLAALGTYSIVAHIGDKTVYGSFEVKEYQKPEYEVTVSTEKKRYLEGETIQATISGQYYFGSPVVNGQVKYSVYKSAYYFPYWRILWGYEDFGDEGMGAEGEGGEDGGGDGGGYIGEEISQGTGHLDANGLLKISVPTAVDDHHRDYTYRVEAHVTDAGNHEIVGGRAALATYSTIVVLLDTDRYVYKPGDQADVVVKTFDYDSQPVSVTVNLAFEQRNGWGENTSSVVLLNQSVTTDKNGAAHFSYKVPGVPWVSVRASTFDSNSREAKFETSMWISGVQYYGEATRNRRPEIYPDKHTYKPGDTAHVLIVTNEPEAQVLVTTEGQQVYTWSLHAVTGGSLTVDIPIEERFEPNFFVGAAYVKNEQLSEATKNIAVPATEKTLKVTVETDKDKYRPNDKVTYTIKTVDSNDKPVSAEVSLGVVDESIYAIQPDLVQPPEKVFYGKSWNRVYTEFSTNYWFNGYSGKNKMDLTRLRAPTQLADFKNAGQVVQPKVRKFFPDTIYWAPSVVTDSSGTARAAFTFPDSLTTWRATVRAISRDTRVGQVTQKVITRKDLILRLEIPRFFTQGDTATLTGIVHNYLASDKTAQVSLEASGVELTGSASSSVTVPKNGEAVVTWTVRAPTIGQAKFLAKALTDEESDALELTAPVRPWGLQLNSAFSAALVADTAESKTQIVMPADINPDASSLRIDIAPSIAGTIFSALDYLATYPYGCVEQTMSSFLPNIIVTHAVKELGLAPPPASIELDQKIAAGLERLYGFQHDDGGWGWWETDETHPFMTAYVVAGLAQAKEAGYPVDEKRLARGRASLLKQINENPRAIADIRAYMVYALVLSGTVDSKLVDGLYETRDKLSAHGQALMALILAKMKDARAQEFVKQLEESASVKEPYVWWKSERDAMLDFSSDNSYETTSYVVKVLSDLDPKSELLPKAARWLIDHRDDGYYWSSTEQTATAIYGLIDYLKVSGELKPNYSLSVFVNGKKVTERTVTEKDVSNPQPFVITLNPPDIHAGRNEVRVVKNGPGVLYWSAFATYFTREPKPAPTGSTALNVVREYFKLVPEKVNDRFVYAEQPLTGAVQSGDIVVVRLTVSATADEQYLQIEDPIPAGFDFIEQENLYELKSRPPWWDFYYTRREFHDDRAALFSTVFQRGQGQFHYLLKAVTPGTFQANPARVLPMYDPARQGSTRSFTITVTPR
ncbi:MAG TPA: MG2 domain-containing protein [Terriglobia bacterium]|nr:MG2 domain-containing protein [Terriglobia bacterium]